MSMTVCLCSCRVTDKVTDDSWRDYYQHTASRRPQPVLPLSNHPTGARAIRGAMAVLDCLSCNNHRTMVTTFICFCFVYLFIFSSAFSTVQTLCLISCVCIIVVVSHSIISSLNKNINLFAHYFVLISSHSVTTLLFPLVNVFLFHKL